MSTSRRRPTGGIRRPQVAGRPRPGRGENETGPDEPGTRPGGVALDDRTGAPFTPPAPGDPDPAGAAPDAGPAPGAGRTDRAGRTLAGDAPEGGRGPGRPAGPDAPGRPDDPAGSAGTGPDEGSAADGGTGRAAGPEAAGRPAGAARGPRLPAAPRSRRATVLLLVATVLLTTAAAFFGVQWYRTEYTGSAANSALADVGATAEVSRQVGEAVTRVYSFDHARLQQAEDDARAVITPAFQPEFERIFGSVRELAPQQQAVVTATIPKSAVASIDGDRATVYVFVNQVIRRQADGGAPQEGAAAARLRVDAELVDGGWKIAAMTPA
ncbi:nuclear transport factor 2 family protein [Pseudonocardia sp. HH130630-07]|uniref:nuclear transport factor 2 family protein n=1 Tax=Pseudonocardia sp. HH130630-07 TaxID=1690815 RepID=UPI000814CB8A|nr:nuclear transport factor 2 family protein [Pseudonocardia sp. HH130630-07]ANY07390.1 hypothetical protein AFB00_15060 [Pseudonocardia sp. HH130630-07]